MFKRFFWLLLLDIAVLGYVGGAEINALNVALGQIATAYYFLHFLVILPLVGAFERPLPLPDSITSSVLHGEKAEAVPAGTATSGTVAE
jgi:ubiquinol-cytochrome c reductase cytochrome b subunit